MENTNNRTDMIKVGIGGNFQHLIISKHKVIRYFRLKITSENGHDTHKTSKERKPRETKYLILREDDL